MTEVYDQVSKNVIENLSSINLALENSKIESRVLTPAFTEKLEKLKAMVNDENNQTSNSICPNSSSFNCSEDIKHYSRQEINDAFDRIKSLPKEFASPPKQKSVKKTNVTVLSRTNLFRANSLQNCNETHKPSSRSNSVTDIPEVVVPKKAPKIEELLDKINENKQMLEGINSCVLKYPDTTHFGRERFKLMKDFKAALAEVSEMVIELEQNVNAIDKDDVDLVVDEELNELLEQFTKTIADYNFLQKNATIQLNTNLNDFELEFPYSSLLEELKAFLKKY